MKFSQELESCVDPIKLTKLHAIAQSLLPPSQAHQVSKLQGWLQSWCNEECTNATWVQLKYTTSG
eukprot:1144445-Pelagomonas_calceolata.AAC.3